MITRGALASLAIVLGVTAVVAQDVISERKGLMKQIGGQAGQGAKFMKGEEPFDLAKAKNIFVVWASAAEKMPSLFPDSSKAGDTASLPAVWENKADFNAKAAKLAADAKAAGDAVKDEASFKTTFPTVAQNCGGCHRTYRKPQT